MMPFPPGAFHFPSVDPLDSSDESAWRKNHQKNYHDAGDNDHEDDDDHCHDDAGDMMINVMMMQVMMKLS